MKKKNILFLMPALLDGGAEKVLIDILRNFDYQKYRVTLCLEFREGVYLNDVPKEVEILALHKRNGIWQQRLDRHLRLWHCYALFHQIVYRLLLLLQIRGRRFDTIISFMEGSAVKFHSYITQRAKNNLSWVHIDLKKKHWSLDFFKNIEDERKAYSKIDKVIFVSEDAKCKFVQLFDFPEDKLEVLYNIIDVSTITRGANAIEIPQPDKFIIVMVGRLNQQKRYDRAIEVAAMLKKNGENVEFWVLGAGELEKTLKQQAKDLDVEDVFLFKGFVKPGYPYMKKADLLLSTSEAEGFSLVVCESFCLGVPVVATKTAGPTELIGKSKAGLLVDDDVISIHNGVKRMMEDRNFLKDCSEKALVFSKSFDVSATMSKIYELID